MPTSKKLVEIARIMEEEGYNPGYEVVEGEGARATLEITLKYGEKKAKTIRGIRRISSRVCASTPAGRAARVLGGLGTTIVSTSNGVMTDRDARKMGIGGEVIAYIW